MSEEIGYLFKRALTGCRRLQLQFPTDHRLASIVEQLEHWASSVADPKPTQRVRAPVKVSRIDPRDIRPIDEDVARDVRSAIDSAERLGIIEAIH